MFEVQETVVQIITRQFSVSADQVSSETLLEEGLGADSMALVELMVNLEESFDIEMPDMASPEVQAIKTVGDIVEFIGSHTAESDTEVTNRVEFGTS